MRIGTWNLRRWPHPDSLKGQRIAAWLDTLAVDLWLLTEVHRDWDPRGGAFVVSPPWRSGAEHKRWSGMEMRFRLGMLDRVGDVAHPGEEEEGLCLARLDDDGGSVLVACSVLPWSGAGRDWPGLPSGQFDEFAFVLEHHVSRIAAERRPGEMLIWGGDFNQPLRPPFSGATKDGAAALRSAFDAFGLVALTEHAEHLDGTMFAIDHLAVSRELLSGVEVAAVHRPARDDGRPISDHAAYTAEIGPMRPNG